MHAYSGSAEDRIKKYLIVTRPNLCYHRSNQKEGGIRMKKRHLGMTLSGLAILLTMLLLLWYAHTVQTIRLDSKLTGSVAYSYGGVCFEEPLTPEQLAVAVRIMDGQKLAPERVTGIPNCPFSHDVAIILGERRFLMACDDCPSMKDSNTGRYFVIDEADCQALKEIFALHGGSFPCIK